MPVSAVSRRPDRLPGPVLLPPLLATMLESHRTAVQLASYGAPKDPAAFYSTSASRAAYLTRCAPTDADHFGAQLRGSGYATNAQPYVVYAPAHDERPDFRITAPFETTTGATYRGAPCEALMLPPVFDHAAADGGVVVSPSPYMRLHTQERHVGAPVSAVTEHRAHFRVAASPLRAAQVLRSGSAWVSDASTFRVSPSADRVRGGTAASPLSSSASTLNNDAEADDAEDDRFLTSSQAAQRSMCRAAQREQADQLRHGPARTATDAFVLSESQRLFPRGHDDHEQGTSTYRRAFPSKPCVPAAVADAVVGAKRGSAVLSNTSRMGLHCHVAADGAATAAAAAAAADGIGLSETQARFLGEQPQDPNGLAEQMAVSAFVRNNRFIPPFADPTSAADIDPLVQTIAFLNDVQGGLSRHAGRLKAVLPKIPCACPS
ncbi:hypothetical protein CXG81DRAFT_17773 [Caulochytrium protostelioides]|uniref:Uncharacterized protein n=1 Tax=Caulochytrium protostelioides TaxID=1555241 RepID=A0A4P9XAZ8_9FUNG|nr:hypothetical protein CXG81DRAFT_17773 [Caulochytrium protostelioides]|eukprot:RKP02563.1 hypothetical protein CXG81DRAFT_17773 [Caulochytrium protostelioides]